MDGFDPMDFFNPLKKLPKIVLQVRLFSHINQYMFFLLACLVYSCEDSFHLTDDILIAKSYSHFPPQQFYYQIFLANATGLNPNLDLPGFMKIYS